MNEYSRIGLQGGEVSFTRFAFDELTKGMEPKPQPVHLYTSKNALGALHRGEVDLALVAESNAQGNKVKETELALAAYPAPGELITIAEFDMTIRHSLIRRKDAGQIEHIVGHDQAIKQCEKTLEDTFPDIGKHDGGDPSLLMQYLVKGERIPAEGVLFDPRNTAILGSERLAQLPQTRNVLEAYAHNLQDLGENNKTTFILVGRAAATSFWPAQPGRPGGGH